MRLKNYLYILITLLFCGYAYSEMATTSPYAEVKESNDTHSSYPSTIVFPANTLTVYESSTVVNVSSYSYVVTALPLPEGATNYLPYYSTGTVYDLHNSTPIFSQLVISTWNAGMWAPTLNDSIILWDDAPFIDMVHPINSYGGFSFVDQSGSHQWNFYANGVDFPDPKKGGMGFEENGSGNYPFFIAQGGYVGIGIVTPSTKFEVKDGSISVNGTSAAILVNGLNLVSTINSTYSAINSWSLSQTTIALRLDNLDLSTASLKSSINSWILSQSTISSRLNNLDSSTATLLLLIKSTAANASTNFYNISLATADLWLTANNTNYVNLSASSQTKSGILTINNKLNVMSSDYSYGMNTATSSGHGYQKIYDGYFMAQNKIVNQPAYAPLNQGSLWSTAVMEASNAYVILHAAGDISSDHGGLEYTTTPSIFQIEYEYNFASPICGPNDIGIYFNSSSNPNDFTSAAAGFQAFVNYYDQYAYFYSGSTLISSAALTTTSDSWHKAKIKVNQFENSINAYFDNVLVLSTRSAFPTTGSYMGLMAQVACGPTENRVRNIVVKRGAGIGEFETGGLIFADSTMTVTNDASNLYYDQANVRLTIGTNTASSALDIFNGSITVRGTNAGVNVSGINLLGAINSSAALATTQFSAAFSSISTLQTRANNLDSSTATLTTRLNNLDTSTRTIFTTAFSTNYLTYVSTGTTYSVSKSTIYLSQVGIGTINPSYPLDVKSGAGTATSWTAVRADPNVSNQGGLLIHQDSTYGWQAAANGTSNATIGNLNFSYRNRSTGALISSASVFAIEADGNIGIGTSAPGQKVDIIVDSDRQRHALRWGNKDGTDLGYLTEDPVSYGSGAIYLQKNASNGTRISANGNSFFTGGNIGVGTGTPTNLLHLYGYTPGINIQNSSFSTTGNTWQIYNVSPFYDSNSGSKLSFAALGVAPAVTMSALTGANKVGINTQNPNQTLDVSGAAVFSGNVGIGTSSPATKLHVVASAGSTGPQLIVTTGTTNLFEVNGSSIVARVPIYQAATAYANPDYVFEKDYKLMELETLQKYTEEKKHLPNMPSTEEVQKNGVNLSEQIRLLQEKLEEAYLYIFEMNKRLEKLENKK